MGLPHFQHCSNDYSVSTQSLSVIDDAISTDIIAGDEREPVGSWPAPDLPSAKFLPGCPVCVFVDIQQ
jgi:hypothetical protein